MQAGILDVDQWLTETPARVLDYWEAFDRVEPIGDQWLQTAQICEMLSRGHTVAMAAVGQKLEPKTIEDLMPARWVAPKTRKAPKRGLGLNAMRAKQERLINGR